MRFALPIAFVFVATLQAFAQPKPNLPPLRADLMAPTDPLSPDDERKQFQLPEGFEAQLVASEPDIQKPIQMAFDAKGRLWVTTSYHYPFATKEKPTDKLFVLSDFDPATGKARKVEKFADDLNIPIGILPLPDCKSCLVSSVGEIRKYTDTNDDGKADQMEVLFKGFGFDDTHGMYNSYTLMPDGWVYACHGFRNSSTVKGKDGHEVKMQSGNTFRFKPDGSRIEIWTHGQVNPFGMTVDPWFNLYTADCHSKPITQLIPGAYYDSFGKPHDGLGFAPHVTDHAHGSTGLCGLVWYDADHFPKEYLGTMFVGNVVTNRINFDKIEWKGATPIAKEQPDFLVSKDRWFRPSDIKLGPDGVLYVADFYNKIIGHYEVDLKDTRRDKERGRIWRIVWKGKDGKAPAPKLHREDFTKAKLTELVGDAQNNPNLTVRAIATQQALLRLQTEQKLSPEDARASFLKLTALLTGAKDRPEDGSEFRHMMLTVRLLMSRPDWQEAERKQALTGLAAKSHKLLIANVEAITLHPHADFVKPLVEVLGKCAADDTHLRMAAKIALRNCLRNLDNWPNSNEVVYIEMATAIPDAKTAEYLTKRLKEESVPADKLPTVAEHVARYGSTADEEYLFRHLVKDYQMLDAILAGFKGVQARGEKLSPTTAKQLFERGIQELSGGNLFTPNPNDAYLKPFQWGSRLLIALPAVVDRGPKAEKFDLNANTVKSLGMVVESDKLPVDLRVAGAEVLLLYAPNEATKVREQVKQGSTSETVRERFLLALVTSGNLDAKRDARDALKTVPYRVAVPVALALASTKDGAEILLDAVKAGTAPTRLLQEKAVLERLRASATPKWEDRVNELTKNIPAADKRIADLLKARAANFAKAKPDKEVGAKLFTKHCAACHKIGNEGGKIAPQLDGIGIRGPERLLEDILDPNRNVDAAFRSRSITLKTEKTLTALVLRVEGEVLVVADLEGKEQRIPLKDIDENRETMLSAMPSNFADVIPEADLYHILAYLLDQKPKK